MQRLGLLTGSIAFFKDGFSALNVLVSVYMWNQAPFATLLFLFVRFLPMISIFEMRTLVPEAEMAKETKE